MSCQKRSRWGTSSINIEIGVDRLVVKPGIEKRLTDSIETVKLSDGLMIVDVADGEPINFQPELSCPDCGISIEEVEPRSLLQPVRRLPGLFRSGI